MKRLVSLILVLSLFVGLCSMFIGCGPIEEEEQPDPERTQIYVGLRESGLGKAWLMKAKQEYEKKNPEIQILIDYLGSELSSDTLSRTMPDIRQTLIFSNQVTPTKLAPISTANATYHVADITDIVLEGGDNSIYNTMDERSREFFNYGTDEEPLYYMIPYFTSTYGMVYDIDMFESHGFFNLECTDNLPASSAYKGAKYKGLDCKAGTEDDNNGPDGVSGTFDDGLPATWEDFKILLNVMVDVDVIPFTFSAKETGYQNRWLSSIWASYEGKNDYTLLTTLEGTDSQFGKITMENAWQLAFQDGKKAALMVADYIAHGRKDSAGNSLFVDPGVYKTGSHTAMSAQNKFLDSYPNPRAKDIAFILEGNWWEVEAMQFFDESVEVYGEEWGYGERNFGYFPFPKFIGTPGIPDQTNTMTTVGSNISNNNAAAFINAYHTEEQQRLAKDFLKFCFTEEMNIAFTSLTGIGRPYYYDMPQEALDEMTKYAVSAYKFQQSEYVDRASSNSMLDVYYYEETFLSEVFGFGSITDVELNSKSLVPIGNMLTKPELNFGNWWSGTSLFINEEIWKTEMAAYLK